MATPNFQHMTNRQFHSWSQSMIVNRPVALQALIHAEVLRRVYGAVGFIATSFALVAAVVLFTRGQLTFPVDVAVFAAVAVPLALRIEAARRVTQIRRDLDS